MWMTLPGPAADRPLRLILATLLPLAAACTGPLEPRSNAPGPTFDVNTLLPQQIVQGPNYVIEPRVRLADEFFIFRLRTRWGIIPAQGVDMLELRLREMYSIALAEQLSRQAHLEAGIASGLEKTGKGLEELLTDPGGVLLRTPGNLGAILQQSLDAADRRAGSPVRRRLASHVRCDPETSNPILKFMLDEMAARQGIGGFLTGTALSAALPGLGMLSAPADMREYVASTPPHAINADIEAQLQQMGLESRAVRSFCREVSYTTSERLFFMMYFRPLRRVPGFQMILDRAAGAPNEAQGLAVIHETALWTELLRRRGITRFLNPGQPVAVLGDGTLVFIRAADYFGSAPPVIRALAQAREGHPQAAAHVCVTGRISAEARRQFAGAGIRAAEIGALP